MKNKKIKDKNFKKYTRSDLENKYIEIENKYIENENKYELEIDKLNAKLAWYEEQLRLNKEKRFGTSSEKTNLNQLSFFNELEAETVPINIEPTLEEITYKRKKKKGHKKEILKNLPVERIEYKLEGSNLNCPTCNGKLHVMSQEIRKEIKIIPAQAIVVEHVQSIYTCRECEKTGIKTPVVTAKMPNPVIKKSLASPSSLSYVMTKKYVESMPLYRQETQLKNLGLALSRQTMSNWMIRGAQDWLKPLYVYMKKLLVMHDVLHADETVLEVLCEPDRPAKANSYMWMYRTSGDSSQNIILYDYQEHRSGAHAQKFLKGFKGFLHVDGYAGYHRLVPNEDARKEGVIFDVDAILVGCWAHARRKYDEAIKSAPNGANLTKTISQQGLDFCNKLFSLEREFAKLSFERRYEERQKRSKPVLEAYFTWAKNKEAETLPKSGIGKAITYSLNQKKKLEAFSQDGRLEISNNRAERSIKSFVIGRKNWLFSNTPRGAESSAIIYSIIETAKANNLVPFYYLEYLFKKLPNINMSDPDEINRLLPWSDTLPQNCKLSVLN